MVQHIFLSMIYGVALLVTLPVYNTPITTAIVILASFGITYKHYRDIYDPVMGVEYTILGMLSITTLIFSLLTLILVIVMLGATGDNNQPANNTLPIVIHFIHITWMMVIAPYHAAYAIKWGVNKLSAHYA